MFLVHTSSPAHPPHLQPRRSLLQALREPAKQAWSTSLILCLLCSLLFFYGLTAGELYRTESLRAIIAAEFLHSGNWIVPTLYGQPLLTKPPGMYAAIALVSAPFGGVTEWSARLPSALAATFTVCLFYGYYRRQLGRRAGLTAAVILPASFMWLDKATAAEIDMLQVFWVTAALLAFLRALEEGERVGEWKSESVQADATGNALTLSPSHPLTLSPSHSFWWLAALLCVAGGVLTKWTAPAFFYMTVIPLLWWRGQLRLLWCRAHLVSAAVAASLCLAWAAAAIYLAGWDALYNTVSREALMRLSPQHHHRPYPWKETLAHPFVVLAANLPWALFALLTLRRRFAALWDERGKRLLQALHCWTWPSLLFWILIPEHAPRHSFPLFPGVAGLAAMVWIAWLSGKVRWPVPRLSAGKTLVAMLILWLGVKLVFVHSIVPMRNLNREPRAKGELLAATVPEGQPLHLFHLKDEGIMFYYGRQVRRVLDLEAVPSSDWPLYCILDETEWLDWQKTRRTELLLSLLDEQGAPMVLVKTWRE